MTTINQKIEDNFLSAEGRYFDENEIGVIEHFAQSYSHRLNAYQSLREKSSTLVSKTLTKLGNTYPDLMSQYGERCRYDMTSVLRYVALSLLRDDEIFFTQNVMSWLDTILVSYKRHDHCTSAYQILAKTLESELPAEQAKLIHPYIDSVILTLQSHAKQ